MMASSAKAITDEIKRNVRAVLLSKIGGVPMEDFNRDYRSLLGQPFPYRKLGYGTLRQCLEAMPDVVRFEVKLGVEHLFGIADEDSFMSSFAVKAQFPEFEDKKDKRRNRSGNRGGKDQSSSRNPPKAMEKNQSHQQEGTAPVSKKYPRLVGNMQGLYGVVVGGATREESTGIEALFKTIGPIASSSTCRDLLFYRFNNLKHAEAVIDKFNGFQLGRFKLKVEPAKEKIPHRKLDNKTNFRTSSQGVNETNEKLQDGQVSPTEEKIQQLNAALLNRRDGQSDARETQVHHGKVQNLNRTANADSAKLKQADKKQSASQDVRREMHDRTSSGSHRVNNSQPKHGDVRHSRHRAGDSQKARTPRQNGESSEQMDIYVGNIANNLLEKDVRTILAPYNPMNVYFRYPPSLHTYYKAIVRLKTSDAERAIQSLNGKLVDGMPLSVRPYTQRPPERVRYSSEGSSACETGTSVNSNVTGVKTASTKSPPAMENNASGDGTDQPMPSLADFIDRFSDVNV